MGKISFFRNPYFDSGLNIMTGPLDIHISLAMHALELLTDGERQEMFHMHVHYLEELRTNDVSFKKRARYFGEASLHLQFFAAIEGAIF